MAEVKKLQSLLPTRREFLRNISIGTAVAGAGSLLSAKLFPAQAEQSEQTAENAQNTTVASEEDIERVTGNGTMVLGPLGSRNLGVAHRLLSGEDVTIRVPSSHEVANSTASILGHTSAGTYGFQATQQGFALYAHAPGFDLDLNGPVTLQGGVLAHYTIRNRTNGSKYLTLWQGDHHDLYTYIPGSLTDAISMLSAFYISDSATGVSLTPKPGSQTGHSVQESSLLVEFGDYLAEVQRVSDADPPSWPGQPGVGGNFYSDDDRILFVSESATARISPWRSDRIADTHLDDMLAELRIDMGSA